MAVKFQGLEEVLDLLDEAADADELKRAMGRACATVTDSAIDYAPKGKGALRRSITSKVDVSGNEIKGVVFTPLEYAPYVEFGTGKWADKGGRKDVPWRYQDEDGEWHTTYGQHPHPFMKPALDDNREEIKRILRGSIK